MTESSKRLTLKLSRLSERFWDNRLWDLVIETRAIAIIGVVAVGFVLGNILPIVEFDDGSVLHTKEIFWAGSIGFIFGMGIYAKKRSRFT